MAAAAPLPSQKSLSCLSMPFTCIFGLDRCRNGPQLSCKTGSGSGDASIQQPGPGRFGTDWARVVASPTKRMTRWSFAGYLRSPWSQGTWWHGRCQGGSAAQILPTRPRKGELLSSCLATKLGLMQDIGLKREKIQPCASSFKHRVSTTSCLLHGFTRCANLVKIPGPAARSFPSSTKRPPGARVERPQDRAKQEERKAMAMAEPLGMKSSCVRQFRRKSTPRHLSGSPARTSCRNLRCATTA